MELPETARGRGLGMRGGVTERMVSPRASRTGWRPIQGKWEGLGLALVALGVAVGLAGLYLSSFTECTEFGAACTRPYEADGLPLEIIGLGALAVGGVVWSVAFLRRPRLPRTPFPGSPEDLTVVPIGPSGGVIAYHAMQEGFKAGLRDREGAPPVCERCGARMLPGARTCPRCGSAVGRQPRG